MTNPETWALIGVFATVMFGAMGLMTTVLLRTLTASINGLRGEMLAKFDAVDARFDAVNTRLDYLDRDVAAISRRVRGEPTTE